jgi:hypothetical protein
MPPKLYNPRCLVCNELVELQEFGFGITSPRSARPSEMLRCAIHSACLREVAAPGYDFSAGLLAPGWGCLVCGESDDPERGLAIVTEFGREGETRLGRAPNHTAHAQCARDIAHPAYEVRPLPGAR